VVALLAVVHVLAAVIGIGPTYFYPALFRSSLAPPELRGALTLAQRLAKYPQIGGPIAVLSGVGLVFAIDPGRLFVQKWVYLSIVLFVVVQVTILGVAVPAAKKLAAWAFHPSNADVTALSPEAASIYRRLRTAHTTAVVFSTLLFALMILKPV
jgi:hypothetical protein